MHDCFIDEIKRRDKKSKEAFLQNIRLWPYLVSLKR